MNREEKTLLERLQSHDWFYGYADDHRVWKKGVAAQRQLVEDLTRIQCPYDLQEIRKAVQDMVVEDFAEEGDHGYWYRQPRLYENVAGVRFEDLITSERRDEIIAWFKAQ